MEAKALRLEDMPKHVSLYDKFLTKFTVSESRCWVWKDNTKPYGYGRIRVGKLTISAHRVSYILHNGDIPEGSNVLHTCDNTACVNPEHLFLGTHQDNQADKTAKGRQARGDTHGSWKGGISVDSKAYQAARRESHRETVNAYARAYYWRKKSK